MLREIKLNSREQHKKACEWLKKYFTFFEGVINLNDERNNYRKEDGSVEINSYNNQFKFYIDAKNISEGNLLVRTLKGFGEIKQEYLEAEKTQLLSRLSVRTQYENEMEDFLN